MVPLVADKGERKDREVRDQVIMDTRLNRNACFSWLSLLKKSIDEVFAAFLSKRRYIRLIAHPNNIEWNIVKRRSLRLTC